jgi:hypothetical protein
MHPTKTHPTGQNPPAPVILTPHLFSQFARILWVAQIFSDIPIILPERATILPFGEG